MPTNVCTPVFEQSDQITCKAAGTIRGKRFVVVGATPTGGMFGTENINIVEVSVAGSRPLGVARYDGISGDQIDVIRGNEIVPCVAGATRNDTSYIQRQIVQTGNTIRRRIENMGIAELSAVITNQSRFMTGTDWSTYAGTANVSRTGITGPVADIMAAFAFVDLEERGHSMDSLILHPTNAMEAMQAFPGMPLTQIFGQADGAENGMSIRNVFVTPRYTLGRALMFEAGQVGTWRNEFPLEEETEYEGPASTTGAQRWWYQWSISPLFAVLDQFSFMEVRGL
jgi:hypothetical protein